MPQPKRWLWGCSVRRLALNIPPLCCILGLCMLTLLGMDPSPLWQHWGTLSLAEPCSRETWP